MTLSRRAGAPKGSLYYYFPHGKASIAAAAVEEAGLRVARTLATSCRRDARRAGEMLRAHANGCVAGWMRQSGFRDGCPITTGCCWNWRRVTARSQTARAQGLCGSQCDHGAQAGGGWICAPPRGTAGGPVQPRRCRVRLCRPGWSGPRRRSPRLQTSWRRCWRRRGGPPDGVDNAMGIPVRGAALGGMCAHAGAAGEDRSGFVDAAMAAPGLVVDMRYMAAKILSGGGSQGMRRRCAC